MQVAATLHLIVATIILALGDLVVVVDTDISVIIERVLNPRRKPNKEFYRRYSLTPIYSKGSLCNLANRYEPVFFYILIDEKYD